jgi:hypothetical protein
LFTVGLVQLWSALFEFIPQFVVILCWRCFTCLGYCVFVILFMLITDRIATSIAHIPAFTLSYAIIHYLAISLVLLLKSTLIILSTIATKFEYPHCCIEYVRFVCVVGLFRHKSESHFHIIQ